MSTTTTFHRFNAVIAVLYPDNVIPNWERATIEANAVIAYQDAKAGVVNQPDMKQGFVKRATAGGQSGPVVEQHARKNVVKKSSKHRPKTTDTITSVDTLTNGRKPRDVAVDAKTVVEALSKSSGFLTLKRMYGVLGLTGYSRINELTTELSKLGVVETKVTIPYGRGYARCFSVGPLPTSKDISVTDITESTQTV